MCFLHKNPYYGILILITSPKPGRNCRHMAPTGAARQGSEFEGEDIDARDLSAFHDRHDSSRECPLQVDESRDCHDDGQSDDRRGS